MTSDPIFPSELEDLETDLTRFSASLQQFADRLGLNLAALEADHIAVRCHQNSTAERWKRGLTESARCSPKRSLTGVPSVCLSCISLCGSTAGSWTLSNFPGQEKSATAMRVSSMWKSCCAAIIRRWACAPWRCSATTRWRSLAYRSKPARRRAQTSGCPIRRWQ